MKEFSTLYSEEGCVASFALGGWSKLHLQQYRKWAVSSCTLMGEVNLVGFTHYNFEISVQL